MKKYKFLALAIGTVSLTTITNAQTPSPEVMLRLSQYNYSFGTARSAALGGAFTSLGADLSSMAINPAGLGMYQSSDAVSYTHLDVYNRQAIHDTPHFNMLNHISNPKKL